MALAPVPRTPPTPITGLRSPEDISSLKKQAILDKILMLEPSSAPFTLLTSKMNEPITVGRYDAQWPEQDPYPRDVEIEGDQAAGDVSLEVVAGQGARMAKFYVYKNQRTGEVFRVTSMATDTATVRRGVGGFSAAMNDGDICTFIGAAYEDGADIGTLKSVPPTLVGNNLQIFRTVWGHTGRNENGDFFGGADPDSVSAAKMIEHKQDQELAAFFGAKDAYTGPDGEIVSFTGGATYFLKTNLLNFATTPLVDRTFVETLEFTMKYGEGGQVGGSANPKKTLFASRRWVTELEMIFKDKLRPAQGTATTKWGLKIKVYESTHGDVAIIPMNCFTGEWARFAFMVDMNHVRRYVYRNRDTRILEDRGGNGVDGTTRELLTDCGYMWANEAAHAIYVLPSA